MNSKILGVTDGDEYMKLKLIVLFVDFLACEYMFDSVIKPSLS